MKYCTNCGNKIEEDNKFCEKCGCKNDDFSVIGKLVPAENLRKNIFRLLKKQKKILLPITILIASIIFGGFVYVSQVNEQKYVEKQRQIELQLETERAVVEAKQTQKEYSAKRTKDCYDILTSEMEKWNNVESGDYIEHSDICIIRYKALKPDSEEMCDKIFPSNSQVSSVVGKNWLCKNGLFSKEF